MGKLILHSEHISSVLAGKACDSAFCSLTENPGMRGDVFLFVNILQLFAVRSNGIAKIMPCALFITT